MNTKAPSPQTLPDALSVGAERNPRTTFAWISWLMLLLIVMMGTLVMYLRSFEIEETQRQRAADGQWLEQSVLFHFRRFEEDLRTRVAQGLSNSGPIRQGLLMTTPDVVQTILWIPEGHRERTKALQGGAYATLPDSFELSIMLDIAKELQRAAYALEMQDSMGSGVWVAVPVLDQQARFSGHVVSRFDMQPAIAAMVPAWFSSANRVQLRLDSLAVVPENPAGPQNTYRVHINLPGFDFALDVENTGGVAAPWAPRLLTVAALTALVGMLISLYVLRQDLRKRQLVQAALHDEMALRQAMENSVTTGLRAWDMNGRIIFVNQAFCDMVGYSEDELLGRQAPLPYWPADQISEIESLHQTVRESGTTDQGIEVTFQHRSGRRLDVLVHEAPLYASDGHQWGWMSSVLDISERKRMERVAQQQQRQLEASGRLMAVGEVASTLAHELNQPLGALSGFATGLMNRLEKQDIALEEVRPVVSRIQQMADRAGNIIRRINAFARKREMQQERVSLQALFKQRLQTSMVTTRTAWHLPDAEIWILGDSTLLEHAFRNLIQNALDWARPSAASEVKICISVERLEDAVEIRFDDNGPGVSDHQRDRIFDAFYTQKEGGMGMGLSIVRSVIEAHRGSIDVVRSQTLGGACFVIRLPLDERVRHA